MVTTLSTRINAHLVVQKLRHVYTVPFLAYPVLPALLNPASRVAPHACNALLSCFHVVFQ